jgi:hypothetical protein
MRVTRPYLVVQSYRGSAVYRNQYEDATVLSSHDTIEDAYIALDVLTDSFGEVGREDAAAGCFVVDAERRPVERHAGPRALTDLPARNRTR